MLDSIERFLGRLLSNRHGDENELLARDPRWAHQPRLTLTSAAFADGASMPRRYTQDAEDRFPPLAWSGVPAGARELVVVVEDVDAPLPRPIVHAIVVGLPPTAIGELREDELNTPGRFRFGKNIRGKQSYSGPRPVRAHGPHRYVFELFALSEPLPASPPPTKKTLRDAFAGRVLAVGELIGTYERN